MISNEEALKRIISRNRGEEVKMDLTYFEEINKTYRTWITRENQSNVIYLDVDRSKEEILKE